MDILVACEESQRVCVAFRLKGHRAFSCDTQDCSGGHPEWHIKGDVIPLLNGNCTFQTADTHTHTQVGRWDMIIAFPPCTYLSNAGAVRLYKSKGVLDTERVKKGILGRDLFMRILWADCEKIIIENPIPSKVFVLPPYTQIVQPYEHGEPYQKKTCLWLKGVPPLVPTNIVDKGISWISAGSKDNNGNPRKNKGTTFRDSKNRSKTFQGIANAMAEQWG